MLRPTLLILASLAQTLCMDCGNQKANYATCSIDSKSGLTGTVDFAQTAPLGCFGPHDPIEILVSLDGFKTDDTETQHALIVKEYGDLANGCQATGPIFRAHDDPKQITDIHQRRKRMASSDPTGFLGNYEEGSDKVINIRNSVAKLRGKNSIIGRSLVILSGPYPSNAAPIGCCVIGVSDGSRFAGMPKQPLKPVNQNVFGIKTAPVHDEPVRSAGFFATHDPFGGRAKSLPFSTQDEPRKPTHSGFGFDLHSLNNIGSHDFGQNTFGGHDFGGGFSGGSKLKPSISNLNNPPTPTHFPGELHNGGSPLFGNDNSGDGIDKKFGFNIGDFTTLTDDEKHIPSDGDQGETHGGSSSHYDDQQQGSNQGYNDDGSNGHQGSSQGYDGQSGGSQGYDGQSGSNQGSSQDYNGQSAGSQGSNQKYDDQSEATHGSNQGYDGQSGSSQGSSQGYDDKSASQQGSGQGYDAKQGGYNDQSNQGGSAPGAHDNGHDYATADQEPSYTHSGTSGQQDAGYAGDQNDAHVGTVHDAGPSADQVHPHGSTIDHGTHSAADHGTHDPYVHNTPTDGGYSGQDSGNGYAADDQGGYNNPAAPAATSGDKPYSSPDQGNSYADGSVETKPIPSDGGSYSQGNVAPDAHAYHDTPHDASNDIPHDQTHDIPHDASHVVPHDATYNVQNQPTGDPVKDAIAKAVVASPKAVAKPAPSLSLEAFHFNPKAVPTPGKPTHETHEPHIPVHDPQPATAQGASDTYSQGGSYAAPPAPPAPGADYSTYNAPPPPHQYNQGYTNPPGGDSTSYTKPPTPPV